MNYSIERVKATKENTQAILDLTRHDLVVSGMPAIDAERIVTDGARIERIQRKLATTADFTGAIEDGKLIGYIQSHEWYTGDQIHYAGGTLEKLQLRMHDLRDSHRLPGRPLGIFALNVADSLNQRDKATVANDLLVNVLMEKREGHGIARTALSENDPLTPVFEGVDFKPTGKFGSPLGMKLQLYDAPLKKGK